MLWRFSNVQIPHEELWRVCLWFTLTVKARKVALSLTGDLS